MTDPGLRILYLATKPAFPPTDGGKLLMWNTLKQLAARGHRITLVAPDLGHVSPGAHDETARVCTPRLIHCRPGKLLPSFIRASIGRRPLSVVRHSHPALRLAVRQELARASFDVIHLEQVQSLFNLPTDVPLPPLVLRAQNVESHLWQMVARIRPRLAWIARAEARKMAALEAHAVRRVASMIALTPADGAALAGGAGPRARRVRVIPPSFPSALPCADKSLQGAPPIILMGGGWLPNRDSVEWFFDSLWSHVRAAVESAHVHVFGGTPVIGVPAASWHRSPTDSRELFCRGAVLLVPLRVASGIRMKILESWARGIPVIATREAVGGLGVTDGRQALLVRDGPELADAVAAIRRQPAIVERMTRAGRRQLVDRHGEDAVGSLLEEAYREAIAFADRSVEGSAASLRDR